MTKQNNNNNMADHTSFTEQ